MDKNLLLLPILSIRQPWAWLIANGFKDIENRNWRTGYKGKFLIHAAKRMDDMSLEEIINYYQVDIIPSQVELQRGGIVGMSNLTACVTQSDSKWFHGPFGFKLDNSSTLPFYPCRGQLGFFWLN